jgi:TPR repeat protein
VRIAADVQAYSLTVILLFVLEPACSLLFSQENGGNARENPIVAWQDMRAEEQYDHAASLYSKRKYTQAAVAFNAACNHLNAKACSNLGFMYTSGVGVKRNYKLAAELYRRGCEGGNSVGCSNLGVMYWQGKLPKDDERAVELFEKACNGAETGGCLALGFMYENGQGVRQDTTQAAALYRKACNLRNEQGCVQLSLLKPQTEEADATPVMAK